MASSTQDVNLSKLQETVKDRGAWSAAVHVVAKSRTCLSDWTTATMIVDAPRWHKMLIIGKPVGVRLREYMEPCAFCSVFLSFFRVSLLLLFWSHCVVCRILVPQPGIQPVSPAVGARSPNYWTTREVPDFFFFFNKPKATQKIKSIN